MEYTHIVVKHSADDKEYIYRASDGMRIGGRQYAVVVYGEDPNKSVSRVFQDAHQAHTFLCEKVAYDDWKACNTTGNLPAFKVDFKSGDPENIVIPQGMGEEFMGSTKYIRKVV